MKHLIYIIFSALFFVSCNDNLPAYLIEQGFKQGSLIIRSKNIEDALKNPGLNPEAEMYLKLSQRILEFAKNEMGMKVGKNYQHYIPIYKE